MTMSLEKTRSLARSGRHAQIAAEARSCPGELAALSQEHRLLIAQALLHGGDTRASLAIVLRENDPRADALTRSKCELIVGLVRRRKADLESALRHLNLALQLAKESGNAQQIAWASIQLFRLVAELHPADELAALLRQVRSCVTEAGDPHAMAYMHDAMALMEMSRGCLPEARRHQAIGASLITSYPNAWLEQISHIGVAYVDYFDGRYEAAIGHLTAARRLAPIVGSNQTAIIDCNEGHALIAMGRLSEAADRLNAVSVNAQPLLALGSLEGLARTHLATGQLEACRHVLDRIDALAAGNPRVACAFGGRWAKVTRAKLLLRMGCWQEAATTAEDYLQHATRLRDRFLRTTLSALCAEALTHCNEKKRAAHALLATIASAEGLPDQQSTCYRAIGAVLSDTDEDLARVAVARAQALWDEQGNRHASLELPPLQITGDLAIDEKRPSPSARGVAVANTLGSAFSLAHSPKLLGREMTNAVRLLRCSTDVRVVEESASSEGETPNTEYRTLELGEHRGRRLTLVCRTPDDPAKAVILGDVLRVGRAAVDLERYREDERARAALWPADPVEAQTGALFLAEDMQSLLATARRVAATTVPVLITGETGTGKEILARTVHACSGRAHAAFLPFNCAATPRDLLEAQLFGHRRGAFTGATDHFPGVIRSAAGGTLFLDEIGETGLDVQPKLLRFLESGEVHPVGDAQPTRVDVRIIAATNADLDALVADGRFRDDLFYRLNIVRLHVPPLRERRVEIPTLAARFLQQHAREWNKGHLRLAEETVEYLVLYRWPGNVRQLANEMRRLAALAERDAVLMPEHLSHELAASRRTRPATERALDPTELVVRLDQPMAAAVEHLERTMVQNALAQSHGRVEDAAARLGLSRKGLYLKRLRFGLIAADQGIVTAPHHLADSAPLLPPPPAHMAAETPASSTLLTPNF